MPFLVNDYIICIFYIENRILNSNKCFLFLVKNLYFSENDHRPTTKVFQPSYDLHTLYNACHSYQVHFFYTDRYQSVAAVWKSLSQSYSCSRQDTEIGGGDGGTRKEWQHEEREEKRRESEKD